MNYSLGVLCINLLFVTPGQELGRRRGSEEGPSQAQALFSKYIFTIHCTTQHRQA
jgi:hypothetical protein